MDKVEWFAIIAIEDVYNTYTGRLEYSAGDVVSYGSVVDDDDVLSSKGLTKYSVGLRNTAPDFSTEIWDSSINNLRPMTTQELLVTQGGS